MSREADLATAAIDLYRSIADVPGGYEAGREFAIDVFAVLQEQFGDIPSLNLGSLLDLIHLYSTTDAG